MAKMKILFYDGNCGLCQRSVQFLYQIDKDRQLHFAPLNGDTYKQIYRTELSKLTTLKYYDGQKTFLKSSAILEILWLIGGIYKLSYILKIIPPFLRDYIYDFISNRRSSLTCLNLIKNERFLL